MYPYRQDVHRADISRPDAGTRRADRRIVGDDHQTAESAQLGRTGQAVAMNRGNDRYRTVPDRHRPSGCASRSTHRTSRALRGRRHRQDRCRSRSRTTAMRLVCQSPARLALPRDPPLPRPAQPASEHSWRCASPAGSGLSSRADRQLRPGWSCNRLSRRAATVVISETLTRDPDPSSRSVLSQYFLVVRSVKMADDEPVAFGMSVRSRPESARPLAGPRAR